MIALVIFGLLAGGVTTTFLAFSKGLKVSMEHAEHSANTQYAFERINKKMHSISEPHATSATSFEFTTKDLGGSAERLTIYFDAENEQLIEADRSGSKRVLLDKVESAEFTYYDRFGDETSTLIDINAAKLEIQTEISTTNGTKDIKTETSIITFRNRIL